MIKYIVSFVIGIMLLGMCIPVRADEWAKIDKEYARSVYTPAAPYVKVNPFGTSPLSAILKFSLPQPAKVSVRIKGKEGAPDLATNFSAFQTEWEIPVYGLYPGTENRVEIVVTDNKVSKTYPIVVKTPLLSGEMPWVVPFQHQQGQNGFYGASGGRNGGSFFVFDEYGYIRFVFLNPQDTVNQQASLIHHRLVVDKGDGKIAVYSLLGEKIHEWQVPDEFNSFQHGIYAGPGKIIFLIGTFPDTSVMIKGHWQKTANDWIVAFDLETGRIVKKWHMASILNPERSVYFQSPSQGWGADWAHVNSVQYIPREEALLVSAKHVGFFLMGYTDGDLKWLVSPHLSWEKSGVDGKGPALWPQLLTAVDDRLFPFEREVQQGRKIVDSFHWPMMNHDVKEVGPGVISVFSNNGPLADKSLVSLGKSDVLLFEIDAGKKTVRLKKRIPLPYYADIASGVTYLPRQDDFFVFLSNLPDQNTHDVFHKIYRYDGRMREVLFEASVFYQSYFYQIGPISFYRAKQTVPDTRANESGRAYR